MPYVSMWKKKLSGLTSDSDHLASTMFFLVLEVAVGWCLANVTFPFFLKVMVQIACLQCSTLEYENLESDPGGRERLDVDVLATFLRC